MKTKNIATLFAILAAALYAINIPLSKIFLEHVDSTMMASLLYLGAGMGMLLYSLGKKMIGKGEKKEPLTRKELPYTVAMVVLDIIAPILLMIGIGKTNSANVSLLNNFEIVATSIIALVVFKEIISKRLWFAIVLVTVASAILSFEGVGAFVFNEGSLFVLGACVCWGIENNCTKMISNKSSEEIVIIKGCFSGLGSLLVALVAGENIPAVKWILAVLALGFVAYGLSINFYIMAQKHLGAAKTSAYYSVAPFLGVAFSMLLLGERPAVQFYIAFVIMVISTVLMAKDSIELQHTHEHEHTHTHEHRHGDLVHSHEHTHVHSHLHVHGKDAEVHGHSHEQEEVHGLTEEHGHSHLH
ncbi:MAG: EamA family transporter [Lachnospiraceae bacterium]|nr:EamA family transporter [Lachnospiraceae bacterium]